MEAAGIEPSNDFDATVCEYSGCVFCPYARAANALHSDDLARQELAVPGSDSQSVQLPEAVARIALSWPLLPRHIREAVLTLTDAGLASVAPGLRAPSVGLAAPL